MPASYRIAGRLTKKDGTKIETASQFSRCIRDIFSRIRPRRIIETGTYFGTGTTTIIASALRDLEIEDARFISIEVNSKNIARAKSNLEQAGLAVELWHGLSVPRSVLPTPGQIQQSLVNDVIADDLIVDHEESDRVQKYFSETDFPEAADDMLGKAMESFDHHVDFLLLDSGGHMGYVEFRYALAQLSQPCYLALDDIYHVKHYLSYREISEDRRFELVAASEEKFGFCIARFDPNRK